MASKAYLTPEDAEGLAQAATCVRDELLVRVLFWASCRISEALALTVDDVDPNQGTITIKHLKTRIRLLCPYCDTRLSRAAKFCPTCGQEVPLPLQRGQDIRRINYSPGKANDGKASGLYSQGRHGRAYLQDWSWSGPEGNKGLR